MNVAIVGCGVEGSTLAGLLVREDVVDRLLLVSRDGGRAGALAERLRAFAPDAADRCRSYAADATDREQLVRALAEAEIVVQATSAATNTVVLDACLDVGAHYIDMASYGLGADGTSYDERLRSAGLVAISNTGASPGVTDLLARRLREGMASVTAITVRWADRSDASDLMPPTTAAHTYTVCMPSPKALEHGELVDRDLFGDADLFEWPDPIGTMRMFPARIKAEMYTLGEAMPDVERIEAKVGMGIGRWRNFPEIWTEGVRRAFARDPEGGRPGNDWLTSGFLDSAGYAEAIADGVITWNAFGVAVTVEGEQDGAGVEKTSIVWTTLENARTELPGTSAMAHLTAGTNLRELILMLCRGEVAERGVVPSVGVLESADALLAALETRPFFRRDL
jgi:hypothetical protein